jgi:hypothetical protein
VAANMIAPPIRSIGTSGMPAISSLLSIVNRVVSVHLC